MDIEQIRDFYLKLDYVSESFPFDDTVLVFKVGSKMFGYIPLDREEPYICLKCDPDRAIDLRAHYDAIEPAYHMNKVHWNGLHLRRGLPRELVLDLVQHSYDLVWRGLTKKERERLKSTASNS